LQLLGAGASQASRFARACTLWTATCEAAASSAKRGRIVSGEFGTPKHSSACWRHSFGVGMRAVHVLCNAARDGIVPPVCRPAGQAIDRIQFHSW